MNDFLAAVTTKMTDPASTGRAGIVGFRYGGGVANAGAVAVPGLGAAVAFCGRQPAGPDVPKIMAR